MPNCPLILSLFLGLINIATTAPTSIDIISFEDKNYCKLSFYKTNSVKPEYLKTSVNYPMDEKIHIRGARSYEVSSSPKAHCCWIFKKRKNGRHWIHKIEKKPGEKLRYDLQFYRKKGYWVTECGKKS